MTRGEDRGDPLGCPQVRELLMEADPEELAGEGEGPLSIHLRECGACRRRARRLARGVTLLDRRLAARAEVRSADELLERVHGEIGSAEAAVSPRTARRSSGRPRPWRVVVPLAAAAVVVALTLWPGDPDGRPAPGEIPTGPGGAPGVATSAVGRPLPGTGEGTSVRVAADERFALLKTDEPTISVVWFY